MAPKVLLVSKFTNLLRIFLSNLKKFRNLLLSRHFFSILVCIYVWFSFSKILRDFWGEKGQWCMCLFRVETSFCFSIICRTKSFNVVKILLEILFLKFNFYPAFWKMLNPQSWGVHCLVFRDLWRRQIGECAPVGQGIRAAYALRLQRV